jgi:hypothetical protein
MLPAIDNVRKVIARSRESAFAFLQGDGAMRRTSPREQSLG